MAAIEDDVLELMVVPGPRDDWFIDPDVLIRTNWLATNKSDRVGMRLVGMPLEYRWPDRQLPSEGATRGAIQVPPNGFPVILGPDHPVTGGYPVIGVVADDDIDRVAPDPARADRADALVTTAAPVRQAPHRQRDRAGRTAVCTRTAPALLTCVRTRFLASTPPA